MAYLINKYPYILYLFVQHIFLCLAAIVISIIIALPVGYFLSKSKLASVVTSILGTAYTIPSIAVFALLIPFVGIGIKPALITLVLYSQFILVRTTISAFRSIDSSVVEVAKAIGLSRFKQFTKIKFPLALPILISGVRVSITSIISITTIAAWINAGGLGVLLFEGLYQMVWIKVIIGTVLIAVLSIISSYILTYLERKSRDFANGNYYAKK